MKSFHRNIENLTTFEAVSEPSSVIRGAASIGSPPSYRRFSSPRPPKLTLERKMSAGILKATDDGFRRKVEPASPTPSVDRLSVTFAIDEPDPKPVVLDPDNHEHVEPEVVIDPELLPDIPVTETEVNR